MSRWQRGFSGRALWLSLLITMSALASVGRSAPLLHRYPRSGGYSYPGSPEYPGIVAISGSTRSIALDGTNAVFALDSETQPGSHPFVVSSGTNFLFAWIENPGDSAELRGR